MTAMYTEEQVLILEKGTLTCEDFDSLLGDYADNDLPKTMKVMMDAHECKCEQCAQSKRTYFLTIKLAQTLRLNQELPRDAAERLRNSLNERLGIQLPTARDHELN